jgi:hypothetical protein
LLVIPHFVQSLSLADLREAASRLERLSTTLGNYAQITHSEHSYRQNHRRTLAITLAVDRVLVTQTSLDNPVARQIAEFERELGEQPQPL